MERISASRRHVLTVAALVVACGLYLIWQIHYRGVYQYSGAYFPIDDADEWRYTACSRLVERGYALFHQVYSAQPPLLFVSLAAGMRVFGDSILGARWVEILFGALSLFSSAWIAWLIEGPLAAAATCLLLAVSPAFLIYSHAVEGEGPMMALATLSLALALACRRRPSRLLPVMAGLALAAAVLVKLFALEVAVPALWAVVTSRETVRRRIEDAVSFLLALAVPLVADIVSLYPRDQWNQVVQLHNRAAQLALPGTTPALKLVGQFLALDLGMSALALAGLLALSLLGRWFDLVFLSLWVLGTVGMLLLFHPLFPHHLAILSDGIAVCAGVSIGTAARIGSRHREIVLPVALAVVVYAVFSLRVFREDRHTLVPGLRAQVAGLSTYVERRSTPSDFVVLDDLAVADRAHRLVPPPLCDPSNVRLRAGYLTSADLINSTVGYRATLVLPSFGIYAQLPGYTAWLGRHFVPQKGPYGHTAWFRR